MQIIKGKESNNFEEEEVDVVPVLALVDPETEVDPDVEELVVLALVDPVTEVEEPDVEELVVLVLVDPVVETVLEVAEAAVEEVEGAAVGEFVAGTFVVGVKVVGEKVEGSEVGHTAKQVELQEQEPKA